MGGTLLVALAAGLTALGSAHAAETRFDEEGTVKVDAGETIDDTVFLAGETAIIAGVVEGDVFAVAQRVEVTGTVRGNLYCAGETLAISGEVGGNVHAAGKVLDFDAEVGGSGYLAGQDVTVAAGAVLAGGAYLAGRSVTASGQIGRDAHLAGETLKVSGKVERSVRAMGATFTLSSGSSVGRDLRVTVPAEDAATIESGATVNGETIVEVKDWEEESGMTRSSFILLAFGKTLALLVFGLVLVTLFPSLRPSAPQTSNELLRSLGLGLAVLVATPVAIIMIAVSLIGIPVAVVLGMAYAVLLYASTLVVAYFVAQRLPAGDGRRLTLWTALCLLVLFLLFEIPFLGPLAHFLVHVFGLGSLALHLWGLYQGKRGPAGAPTGALVAE
jgi:cytoskeletal protein CcmA (bactofilin family)